MKTLALAFGALSLLALAPNARAQSIAVTVSDCSTLSGLPIGPGQPLFQDATGKLCGVGSTTTTRTIVPLDIATVTAGGTAVTALNAGHRTAGGWLYNPSGATINLCINEQGTASGTTSSNATTCIQPGQAYNLQPAAGAVSVISSDSSHPFSGLGLN